MPINKVFGQAGGEGSAQLWLRHREFVGAGMGMRVDRIEGNKCGWGEVGNGG